MVKTPRTRHSKTSREPVTIDLAPDEVSRVKAEEDGKAEAVAAEAGETAAPETPVEERGQEKTEQPEAVADESSSQAAFGRTTTPTPPEKPASRGGAGLLAGVAGGVVALALAGGLQFAGLIPAGGDAAEDHAPAIAALESQLAALREEVATLDAGGVDPAIAARLDQTEQRLTALADAVETLRNEVAASGSAPGDMPPVDLAPLEERIAAMETAISTLQGAPQQEPVDLTQVNADIAALREELGVAREAQGGLSSRLDALEGRIGDFSTRLDEQAEAPATAIIIAASSLKAAIDRGSPFTTELDTFAALAPDAPQVEGLRAHAATGVATRAQLAAEADAAANAIIAAGRPVDPDAGIADRLLSSAMGLVQVRPVGMVEGDGVPEIAARIDAAVGAGDYERAIAEYDSLPETAKEAGKAFIDKVKARRDVDGLADEALAAALRS